MMAHVDLCSGIGGFALGFQWAGLSKPVLFCDIEPWSRQVLAKHWPDVPIAEDVKELASDPTAIISAIGGRPSILSCGYPCQPFSQAGQRRGSEDDRHIWPEIFTIIQKVRPDWVVCENVSGHITMGLDEVLSDLADEADYAVQTFHLGAVSVDAPHRRMRLWIVAHNVGNTSSSGQRGDNGRWAGQKPENRCEDVADTDSQRGRRRNTQRQDAEDAGQPSRHTRDNTRGMESWLTEPSVGRVAHGIPKRVDRLRGLGNAIVPQIAQKIGEAIKASIDEARL